MLQKTPSATEKLIEHVKLGIETAPYQYDDQVWVWNTQADWCKAAGVSCPTLRKIIKKPPFVYDVIRHNGVKATLIRLGEKGPPSARETAKILVSIWKQETGDRKHSPKEFGCLKGLADEWGPVAAPKLFRYCLRYWPRFMSAQKVILANQQTGTIPCDKPVEYRYFNYPTIATIRRYHQAAVAAYKLHREEEHGSGMWMKTIYDELGLPATYEMPNAIW